MLDICKKYKESNLKTLIVRSQDIYTIWIEEKSKTASSQTMEAPENRKQKANIQTQPNNQPIPTKKEIKKYRGQVYEEEVVDWAVVQQMNQQNNPRCKYRGQYID